PVPTEPLAQEVFDDNAEDNNPDPKLPDTVKSIQDQPNLIKSIDNTKNFRQQYNVDETNSNSSEDSVNLASREGSTKTEQVLAATQVSFSGQNIDPFSYQNNTLNTDRTGDMYPETTDPSSVLPSEKSNEFGQSLDADSELANNVKLNDSLNTSKDLDSTVKQKEELFTSKTPSQDNNEKETLLQPFYNKDNVDLLNQNSQTPETNNISQEQVNHKEVPDRNQPVNTDPSTENQKTKKYEDLNYRQINSIDHMNTMGYIKNKKYRELFSVSHKTAHLELVDLVSKGYALCKGSGRSTRYIATNQNQQAMEFQNKTLRVVV
ncbi:hypothetical protein DID75_01270, partial [Candidatus Marinamargulisbacteria bacterium SCGC AG-410-N11]